MKNLFYTALFITAFGLAGVVNAQQVTHTAQPVTNIHRQKKEMTHAQYKALANDLKLDIHRDRRELRHLHRAMRRQHRHAHRPLRDVVKK